MGVGWVQGLWGRGGGLGVVGLECWLNGWWGRGGKGGGVWVG